jgi:uncharacterized phage infection (PIP) family protein YhgE
MAELRRGDIVVDYQKSTVGETLKLYEALAFRFPVAMVQALDTMADLSAMELQMWWRTISLPAGGFLGAIWPQRATAAELESVSIEVEQIRAELRSDSARRGETEAAAAARFDHLQDQMRALSNEISTVRAELKSALARKHEGAEIEQLRGELNALRQQVREALNERESAPAASASALADLQTELRALRDKMESATPAAQEHEQGKGGRPAGEQNRKRPRR